ncbi:MAG: nitronate monooxygenase [Chloroflexi bacterium]|nr:nitronate monooxygenase [Chloroflexota bacterium]
MAEIKFKTWLTETFGCKYPIIQGGLGYLSDAELAAAVSNAGCLGTVTTYQYRTKERVQEEIRKAKELTSKPFGANVNLFPAVSQVDTKAIAEVVAEEKVAFIETAGRAPEAWLIDLMHGAGIKLIHKMPAVRFALHAEKSGVDAITMIAFEGGGHPGMEEVAGMVLIPRAVDSVKIPVIAAGGISDGRGLVAALSLGAQGVLMGTRFMATKECKIHENLKRRLVEANENETMIIDRAIRSSRRVLRNATAERVLGLQQLDASLQHQLTFMGGEVSKKLWQDGQLDTGVIACGQSVGLVGDIPSVAELVQRIVAQASQVLQNLQSRVSL